MICFIDPNQRDCPICGSYADIVIEDGFIWCDNCTAEFVDPKWADSPEEDHRVTFYQFGDDHSAAEAMHHLANKLGRPVTP